MGWFWADAAAPSIAVVHRASGTPPPSCPMHNKTANSPLPAAVSASVATPPSACPYEPPSGSAASTPSYVSKLNPLNYMPSNLSNKRDSTHQKIDLPQEREESTIPRGDGAGLWEYPSPQQMYNAMLRKGYTDTPAEHVEAMVAVHNFLNEGAWEEIKGWEARFSSGLYKGSELCFKGEEGADRQMAIDHFRGIREKPDEPKLVRFMGRPKEPSPKARMMGFMAWLYPSKFPDNPPFDRHDWYVQRQTQNGEPKEVRYVIDYYSGPPEPSGEPVFFLDVRPALDGPTAACERLLRWGGDVWYRASGASVREALQRQRT